MKRRDFIAAGSAVAAASYRRVMGANDRIHVGIIGAGIQGSLVWDQFLKQPNVSGVAVCDVYAPHVESAVAKTNGEARGYKDFRKLLEQKGVDAVIVATPEHWHALPAVMACQSDKDVYVEKPLALTIREGRLILDAARKYDRVVQVGSMQRSGAHYGRAVELIRNGRIGDVRHISAGSLRNTMPGFTKTPDEPVPAGLDWDMYLGPAPYKPFNRLRWTYHWRWFWDYSGGQMTNLGAHNLDIARWAMNVRIPAAVAGFGGRYSLEDGGETPDVQEVIFQFPKLVMTWSVREMNGATGGSELEFHGTKGTLRISRSGFKIIPEEWGKPVAGRDTTVRRELKAEALSDPGSEKEFPQQVEVHVRNFLDCMRSRKRPHADVEEGYLTNLMCHMGNISMKLGRSVRWDEDKEEIPGDPEASRMCSRPYRKPWELMEKV
jgi:predicted dehydrogenase